MSAAIVGLALLAQGALAQDGFELSSTGELRYIGSLPPDFPVDAEGATVGQDVTLDQRLRVALGLASARSRIDTEWDFFAGQVAGDTWDLPDVDERGRDSNDAFSSDNIVPRRASLGGQLGAFNVEAGLVTSQWGLGMLANDGATEPLFGRADFGDRVLRARVTTAPFPALAGSEDDPAAKATPAGAAGRYPLYLTAAADYVIADDAVQAGDGHRVYQGILSALYADAQARKLGTYLVYRNQREGDRRTRVGVADVYGDIVLALGDSDWTARLALEGVTIFGTTDRALTYEGPEGLRVRSGGVAVETSVAMPEQTVIAHLRGGWGSGDGNADDDVTHDFTFDRDFGVGMTLFDEFMGSVEAGTYQLLTDPEYSAQAPDGAELVATEGAFRRAAFVQPAVEVNPVDLVNVRAGVVLAWATAPVAHPFYSFRAGGDPRNQGNLGTEGYALGTELDWRVRVGLGDDDERTFRPAAVLQGGHAVLADNLKAPGSPDAVHLVTLTGRVRW